MFDRFEIISISTLLAQLSQGLAPTILEYDASCGLPFLRPLLCALILLTTCKYFRHELIFRPMATEVINLTNNSYVLTDFQTTNAEGVSVASEYLAAAKKRGCTFVPIILDCQIDENERRMRSPARLHLVDEGQSMLSDTDVLKIYRGRGDIYKFQCPEQLVLNVSEMSHVQAAEVIIQHMRFVCTVFQGPV